MLRNTFIVINILFLYLGSKGTFADRRITNGNEVPDKLNNHSYVAYFLMSPIAQSSTHYQGWTCGGAIVSKSFILTSAACVEDTKYLYVIAGYRMFVEAERIENDLCTRNMKKKVAFTCVPKAYQLDYTNIEKWSALDIALVKTETPFDFSDEGWTKYCSYTPRIIEVNLDNAYRQPGIKTFVYGWGHKEKWRELTDSESHNAQKLSFASNVVISKDECKAEYTIADADGKVLNEKFLTNIDRYMVCTMDSGYLDERGNVSLANKRSKQTGPCQNDHGGPLVISNGDQDYVIGVASVFKTERETKKCIGPYLFTSTSCTSKFLTCILAEDDVHITMEGGKRVKPKACNASASEIGYELVQRTFSWTDNNNGCHPKCMTVTEAQLPRRTTVVSCHTGSCHYTTTTGSTDFIFTHRLFPPQRSQTSCRRQSEMLQPPRRSFLVFKSRLRLRKWLMEKSFYSINEFYELQIC